MPKKLRVYSALLFVYLFYMMTFVIRTSPASLEPNMDKIFHYTGFGFSMMSASFYYSYALLQLPIGIMIDRYGRKIVVLLSLLVTTAALLLQDVTGFRVVEDILRVILGISCTSAAIVMVKTIAANFADNMFSRLVAVGGWFSLSGSLLAEAPIAILVGYIGFDAVNAVLASICMLIYFGSFTLHKDAPVKTTQSLKVYWDIFMHHNVWGSGICYGLQALPLYAFASLWAPTYIAQTFKMSEIDATLYIQFFFISAMLGAISIGSMVDKFNLRRSALLWPGVLGIVSSLLMIFSADNFVMFMIGFIGAGFISMNVVTTTIVRESQPTEYLGVAFGLFNSWCVLCNAMSQTVFGSLLVTDPSSKLIDFSSALWLMPASMALSIAAVFILKPKY